MLDTDIARMASRILMQRPSSAQFVDAEAQSITASDGMPAVRIIAKYRDRLTDSAPVGLEAMHAIRDALLSQGDDRFVFLENDYVDEPDLPVDDEE